jgi:hypothetical protein
MKFCNLFILGTLCLNSFALAAENSNTEFFISLQNQTYSDPTSIDSFVHEFDGDLESGDYAFIHNTAQVGVRVNNWSLSYIHRYDHFYEFSEDTARLYYENENDLLQANGQSYDLMLRGNHINASGLKAGYDWDVSPALTIKAGLSYLRSNEHYDVNTLGSVTSQTNNTIAGQLAIATQSHRDLVLEFPMTEPSGSGYAIDLGFDWAINEKLTLGVLLKDAVSAIDWDGSLDTDLSLTTASRNVDSNGQISITPLLSGTQRLSSYEQELPRKLFTDLTYQHNDELGLGINIFHTEYFTHTQLAYYYTINPQNRLFLTAGLNTRALGIGLENNWGRFGIAMDNTSYEDAQAVNLIFELNFGF